MMKRIFLFLAVLFAAVAGNAATPTRAFAGCFCGGGECGYDSSTSINCQKTGLLCTMGGGCCKCFPATGAPLAFDGTISRRSGILAESTRNALVRRRACDGAVVQRQYAAAEVERIRQVTQTITV